MARYIDADKIIYDAIKENKFVIGYDDMYNRQNVFKTIYSDLAEFINSQPTADVVEVVRCKDCKYNQPTIYEGTSACIRQCAYKKPTDFCSYGERRDT